MPDPTNTHRTFHAEAVLVSMTMIAPNSQRSTHERTSTGQSPVYWPSARPKPGEELLRKEVIQPHLPVRLPCYDFVPIAGPTFDSSFPCGLGHRLRVLPTFVT